MMIKVNQKIKFICFSEIEAQLGQYSAQLTIGEDSNSDRDSDSETTSCKILFCVWLPKNDI